MRKNLLKNLLPATFRYRLRAGKYPEPLKVGGKRRFTLEQTQTIIGITNNLIKKGVIERCLKNLTPDLVNLHKSKN